MRSTLTLDSSSWGLRSWTERKRNKEKASWGLVWSSYCFLTHLDMNKQPRTATATTIAALPSCHGGLYHLLLWNKINLPFKGHWHIIWSLYAHFHDCSFHKHSRTSYGLSTHIIMRSYSHSRTSYGLSPHIRAVTFITTWGYTSYYFPYSTNKETQAQKKLGRMSPVTEFNSHEVEMEPQLCIFRFLL